MDDEREGIGYGDHEKERRSMHFCYCFMMIWLEMTKRTRAALLQRGWTVSMGYSLVLLRHVSLPVGGQVQENM